MPQKVSTKNFLKKFFVQTFWDYPSTYFSQAIKKCIFIYKNETQ